MNLRDKVVVITGASTGIGKELGFEFARKGAKVVLAARNLLLLEQNAEAIKKSGGTALVVRTDVSHRAAVEHLMWKAFETFGRLDIVINNAGVSPAKGTLLENDETDIRTTMEINFMGGVYGVRSAAPYMEKSGGGLLVFVTSIVGKRGVPYSAAYCASKFAMNGLAEAIRQELSPKNIRVLTVCPPGVDTPFFANNGKGVRRRYRLHPADKIARMITRACEKEKREYLPTLDAKLLHWLNVFFPRLIDWGVAKVKRREVRT